MISGLFVLCGVFAAANAGGLLEYGSGLHAAGPIITEARAAPVLRYSAAPAVSTSYSSVVAPGPVAYAAPIAKTLTYAAPAQVAIHAPAIGSSHQNIIRSFDGTLSHYSKGIDTPFSSVRKVDTRINNNVYSPAIATSYAAPALATSYAAPAYATKTLAVSAPALSLGYAAPSAYAAHAGYAAPATYAAHAGYAAPAVAYSPAASVAHVSYEGLGAKYAW